MKRHWQYIVAVPALAALAVIGYGTAVSDDDERPVTKLDRQINKHAQRTLAEGRQIFRFDTFGDEAFWGDTIKLHQAIQGTRFGGVGPKTALAVGSGGGAKTEPCIARRKHEVLAVRSYMPTLTL